MTLLPLLHLKLNERRNYATSFTFYECHSSISIDGHFFKNIAQQLQYYIFNIITLKRDMIDNNIYNINVREDNMLVCEICVAVGVRCCAVYVAPCSRGG